MPFRDDSPYFLALFSARLKWGHHNLPVIEISLQTSLQKEDLDITDD